MIYLMPLGYIASELFIRVVNSHYPTFIQENIMTVQISMVSLFSKEVKKVTRRVNTQEYRALVTMHGKKNVTVIINL